MNDNSRLSIDYTGDICKVIEEVNDIRDYFKEKDNVFTLYVVEQMFVAGRGHDYLCSFKGKPNYIDSDYELNSFLKKILNKIYKTIPNLAGIFENLFLKKDPVLSLKEIVSMIVNLTTPNEHQAAGPDVIDPVIIQEGKVSYKKIAYFISLHKESILRPSIIILLKDNNFERAKHALRECPHGINVKFIRNSGEVNIIRIINPGADSINDFVDAYSSHCFSTCARTEKSFAFGLMYSENSAIERYGLELMRIRSNMLFGDKTMVKDDLDRLIEQITFENSNSSWGNAYLKTFEAVSKLFRLFCNDGGEQDIVDAKKIADELDNDVLKAHVMRNSYFLPKITLGEMNSQMEAAREIFSANNIMDYSIYSENNLLVRQFDSGSLDINRFIDLQAKALYAVPGLVGMSHIINNAGAALLTYGKPEEALSHFKKALDYTIRPERAIQDVAVRSNILIAYSKCYKTIKESEFKLILDKIFGDKSVLNLPFLSARYALNVISVACFQDSDLGKQLLSQYHVSELIYRALKTHKLGSGQLIIQLKTMLEKYGRIPDLEALAKQTPTLEAKGIRKDYIINTGFNPCSFSTWF